MTVTKSNEQTVVEVIEGSHVFVKNGQEDVFIDWGELGETDRGTVLELRDKIDRLTGELGNLLQGLSSKPAA